MFVIRPLPRALAACFVLCLFVANAAAQTTRPRQVTGDTPVTAVTDTLGRTRLENDVYLVEESDEEEEAVPAKRPARLQLDFLQKVMLEAIEDRLGTPYRLGTEGPTRYDCSGFVWSVFQEAGIDFERTSARTFWSQFAPAREDEKYQFGTLVFFNNLGHVGIVADENGFYHASTSRGVTYSPFSDYWRKRINGFRRVPVPSSPAVLTAAGR